MSSIISRLRIWTSRSNYLLKSDWFDKLILMSELKFSNAAFTRYAGNPLNPAFASRLEAVIKKYHPDLWIHGQTHEPCDYALFNTRVICNPRGYPGENRSSEFRDDLVVSIR